MNIDTLTLECFLAVAATGSFTKAASRINRTQSAVSQQVAKLENFVSKKLLLRGKKLVLTSEGEVFHSYAQKILKLHLEAVDRFNESKVEGQVRFGIPEDFATLFLADVLIEFVRVHPQVILNIECDLTLNLYERFKKKEFDMVLVKMSRPEDFPNGLEVWSEKLEWVGDQNVLLPFLEENKAIPLVLSPAPCVYRASALAALNNANIPWQTVFSSPSYNGTIAAVKAGLGVTVLSKTMIPKDMQALKHDKLPELSDTHVSLLKHSKSNAAIQSFEEFVLKIIKH